MSATFVVLPAAQQLRPATTSKRLASSPRSILQAIISKTPVELKLLNGICLKVDSYDQPSSGGASLLGFLGDDRGSPGIGLHCEMLEIQYNI